MVYIKNLNNLSPAKSVETKRYVDLDMTMKRHSSGDVSSKADVRAVMQAIRTIVLTNPGEIDEEPTFGVGVWSLLGENALATDMVSLEDKIREQVGIHETRAELSDVSTSFDQLNHLVTIAISFYITNATTEETLSITVNREL